MWEKILLDVWENGAHSNHSNREAHMSSVEFLESKAGTTQEKGAAALVLLRASNHLFGLPCYERDWCRGDRIAVRLLDAVRGKMGFPEPQNHVKLEESC